MLRTIDAGVSAIAFHPTRDMAISASYGGDFKLHSIWDGSAIMEVSGMRSCLKGLDGSVLAVAAETFITLWDQEKNVLLAVIGSAYESIVNLSFIGESNICNLRPEVQIHNSQYGVYWSYKLDTEVSDILFPIASWVVTKVKVAYLAFLKQSEGGIAFIKSSRSIDDNPDTTLLAYVNGDHEYALFNPHGTEMHERTIRPTDRVSGLEGAGDEISQVNKARCLTISLEPLQVWICQILQEISQKRTRERMSDQEAKEIKAKAREIMPQPSTVYCS
ncbi:WD repeat-containing protein 75 [Tanacetum coccineum]